MSFCLFWHRQQIHADKINTIFTHCASPRSLCCFSALLKRCGHYHGCRPDASCIKSKLDLVTHPEAMCQGLRKPPKLKKKQLMLSLKSAFEKPMWNRVGCIHLSCTAYDLKSSLTFSSIKNSPSILKVQYVKYHRCTGEKFSFLLFPMQMHIASYSGLCKTNISYCHSCVVSVGCLLFISDRVYVSLLWSEPDMSWWVMEAQFSQWL